MAITTTDPSSNRRRAFDVSTETGIDLADSTNANYIIGSYMLLRDSNNDTQGCNVLERDGNSYGRVVTNRVFSTIDESA